MILEAGELERIRTELLMIRMSAQNALEAPRVEGLAEAALGDAVRGADAIGKIIGG